MMTPPATPPILYFTSPLGTHRSSGIAMSISTPSPTVSAFTRERMISCTSIMWGTSSAQRGGSIGEPPVDGTSRIPFPGTKQKARGDSTTATECVVIQSKSGTEWFPEAMDVDNTTSDLLEVTIDSPFPTQGWSSTPVDNSRATSGNQSYSRYLSPITPRLVTRTRANALLPRTFQPPLQVTSPKPARTDTPHTFRLPTPPNSATGIIITTSPFNISSQPPSYLSTPPKSLSKRPKANLQVSPPKLEVSVIAENGPNSPDARPPALPRTVAHRHSPRSRLSSPPSVPSRAELALLQAEMEKFKDIPLPQDDDDGSLL